MTSGKALFILLQCMLAITALNATSVDPQALECPQVCPALYAPLCASADGNNFQQFDNNCEMTVANCGRARNALQTFATTDMYWCTSESVDNLLEALSNLDLQTPECRKACPLIYAPVCVSNGRIRATLSNECIMGAVNCALDSKIASSTSDLFRVLRRSEC